MFDVQKSEPFATWLDSLGDTLARARVLMRLDRVEDGHFGDVGHVGEGVYEMRINHGPGYRLYYYREGESVIFMLLGGDKGSQKRDIKKAISMANELRG
ncbi:putative addiction module killer protein [Variovorax sp. PBL-H6]|uniref:type II toxin-antitoxin system RelE/ParE family toxin n=1 Tax=Variovorax sp. PBL-H6 TaxID=434009 RepID=UPI0013171FEC|nr:type II toxin-antitoxin system RelE/ParE family toxin [Variovorax sp. PBL-H6]VTU30574.1 putative addiction module killer protein [Variovorax sp. PBL-H6]